MRKTFQYRLYPSRKQTTKFNNTLNQCRWLYNHLLEQRKNTWETEKKSLSYFDQVNTLPDLKQTNPMLQTVHSQILLNVAARIDLAFKAFFRRIKSGDKPGYPRFRGNNRYDSFAFPQSGFKLLDDSVELSKIGIVKAIIHRPIEGTIKTCTIKRTPNGKWFVSFSCDTNQEPIERPVRFSVGIDMGLESFATLSNGKQIENPRFFRQEEKSLTKAQRKLSAQDKATKARAKARKVVARIYERITWKRHDFVHQESRKLVNRFDTIAVEDLSINDMQKNNFRGINKSIGDAAWRMFLDCISYKAEWAGKRCIRVNPAYTSQICSRCGTRHKLKLSERVYHCQCGLSLNRDVNAAKNILALGLQSIGLSKKVVSFG